MSVSGKNKYNYFRFVNRINNSVSVRNSTAPLPTTVALQLLRFSRTCFGMFFQFIYQTLYFSIRFGLMIP